MYKIQLSNKFRARSSGEPRTSTDSSTSLSSTSRAKLAGQSHRETNLNFATNSVYLEYISNEHE